ncbi:molybdate ABC transporter substrate-binding protein [Aliidiomarina sanyensis]|uniref:Molybdate ABC transporter substrate-binding protein n=1 Tax=Aliidiomarina sanyensis TaxID=1249555 RepID=A0A432WRH2_9GAMM|nr:molybdate ABC transporter substrate-binding protein [Aliidiomarina sanyensis]RUO36374.1 molybdate ABC transporter substrate-binding protein [Aliidiomarina sanyensis]
MRMMLWVVRVLLCFGLTAGTVYPAHADRPLQLAVASDLRFAMQDMIRAYNDKYPNYRVQLIFGSSGKLTTQIQHGAPYDILFAADIAFPERLVSAGLAAGDPEPYALGRLVLWSRHLPVESLGIETLEQPRVRRIAIAQPQHAPYGMRAQQALEKLGLWDTLSHKIVYAENIAQAAQMAQSGAVDVAIIAQALARSSGMQHRNYYLLDEALHEPLVQGFVVTIRGNTHPQLNDFLKFIQSSDAAVIKQRYGFGLISTLEARND